jgi:hypothetical protein
MTVTGITVTNVTVSALTSSSSASRLLRFLALPRLAPLLHFADLMLTLVLRLALPDVLLSLVGLLQLYQ